MRPTDWSHGPLGQQYRHGGGRGGRATTEHAQQGGPTGIHKGPETSVLSPSDPYPIIRPDDTLSRPWLLPASSKKRPCGGLGSRAPRSLVSGLRPRGVTCGGALFHPRGECARDGRGGGVEGRAGGAAGECDSPMTQGAQSRAHRPPNNSKPGPHRARPVLHTHSRGRTPRRSLLTNSGAQNIPAPLHVGLPHEKGQATAWRPRLKS